MLFPGAEIYNSLFLQQRVWVPHYVSPSDAEWARFKRYARRLKYLWVPKRSNAVHLLHEYVQPRLREELENSLGSGYLFPRLTDLRWFSAIEHTCDALVTLSPVISRLSLALDLKFWRLVDSWEIADSLRHIHEVMHPTLAKLSELDVQLVDDPGHEDSLAKSQGFRERVPWWTFIHLRRLNVVHEAHLTEQMVLSLMSLPVLSELDLCFQMRDRDAGYFDKYLPKRLAKAGSGFPALQRLKVVASALDCGSFFELLGSSVPSEPSSAFISSFRFTFGDMECAVTDADLLHLVQPEPVFSNLEEMVIEYTRPPAADLPANFPFPSTATTDAVKRALPKLRTLVVPSSERVRSGLEQAVLESTSEEGRPFGVSVLLGESGEFVNVVPLAYVLEDDECPFPEEHGDSLEEGL
ncbi:uncharacterized protein BXZ73DRAFT_107208 [Epithele typhae]|uniref:uncharacterized protein n=1 Tax=Epithele typhae TaxID=378194 RepID=UPI00200803FA|nr:uncharacterized protein BXZ73DRAFT_107208 [Epithele typhae]KAH9912760.1 hypothetical protein BXZ73DRAFT_107208 [Epithele typhae]